MKASTSKRKLFENPLIERLFRVLNMLQSPTFYTLKDIAHTLGTSERTAFRYIASLKNSGIAIECVDGFQRIDQAHCNSRQLLGYIASAKAWQLVDNIEKLESAISGKRFATLIAYSSAHGKTVSDRLVEPFRITNDKRYVWCYDPSTNSNKIFRIQRCSSVKIEERRWADEDKFQAGSIDIFGFCDTVQIPVSVRLSQRAKDLLLEEFPGAEFVIKEAEGNSWVLNTKVCDLHGIGRFCMGLLSDIEVLKGKELKQYINDCCRRQLEK